MNIQTNLQNESKAITPNTFWVVTQQNFSNDTVYFNYREVYNQLPLFNNTVAIWKDKEYKKRVKDNFYNS